MIACGLVGCGGDGPGDTPTSVDIGFVWPYTGAIAASGTSGDLVIRLTVDKINAEGNLPFELNLVAKDDLSTEEGAAAATQELLDSGVKYFLGPYASPNAAIMIPKIVQADGMFLNTIAAAASLAGPQNDGRFFRMVPPAGVFTALNARNVVASLNKSGKIAILYEDSLFYREVLQGYNQEIPAACSGGSCLVTSAPWPSALSTTSPTYAELLNSISTNIMATDPDIIVLLGTGSVSVGFMKELAVNKGFTGQFWGTETISNLLNFVTLVGAPLADRFHFTTACLDLENPELAAFFAQDPVIRQTYHYPAIYDGILNFGLALAKAGPANPGGVAAAMNDVGKAPGTQHRATDYGAAVADVLAGVDVDFEGLNSSMDFNDIGELTSSCIESRGFDAMGNVVKETF